MTRRAIFDHVPEAKDDKVLFRYVVFALWTSWRDDHTNLRVLPQEALDWIGHHRYDAAQDVIGHIQAHLDLEIEPHIPNRRCRLVRRDGLPGALWKMVRMDLRRHPSTHEDRVYVLSGDSFSKDAPTALRKEIREELDDVRHEAPSLRAQYAFERLNFGRPPNLFARVQDHLGAAYRHVERMDIGASPKKESGMSINEWHMKKRKLEERQRREYRKILCAIAHQHKPFYEFSSKGRTDRLFAYNRSALELPKEVRRILFQDFWEIDLKSAHLLIAAWLWDARDILDVLTDEEYSIWDDLMQHYAPLFEDNGYDVPVAGGPLYGTVKSALKVALYSTVYGMAAPSVQAGVTRRLSDILGETAGAHFREHPVIERLLARRDEKLRGLGPGTVLHGPTGIRAEVTAPLGSDDGTDARSAMATIAQSYEQECMYTLLELEEEREREKSRNHFKVALWLHDGAYVRLRSPEARMDDLHDRLDRRRNELAAFAGKPRPLPAFFELEHVDPPPLPGADSTDN